MIIVTANSPDELEQLIQEQPEAVILAWPGLSLRQNVFLTPDEMAAVIQRLHDQGIRVYLNALKMVMEEDLPAARELIRFCEQQGVDGLYVADEGYFPLAQAHQMMDRLIYQPETLIVNAMDVQFYRDLGLQAVSLAHELSKDQVLQIAQEADGLEVLVQGRYSWMYSYRPLLENYLKEIGGPALKSGPGIYTLQEANRQDRMPVEQTGQGVMVYSSAPIQSLQVMPELKQAGIDRFRIDTYLEDPSYGVRQLRLYRQALEAQDPAVWWKETASHPDVTGSDAPWHTQTALRKEA